MPNDDRSASAQDLVDDFQPERQLTDDGCGHILTNAHVWSPDSQWIVFDTRSDVSGSTFDGRLIQRVHLTSQQSETIYEATEGSHCGVATYHPFKQEVLFIQGPQPETVDWPYGPFHRRGVIVDLSADHRARPMDAMNYAAPFRPGALRGGSHVHVFSRDGSRISFTYEDHVLAQLGSADDRHDQNQRNIGVSLVDRGVTVARNHPRNHDGSCYSVLVTRTTQNPQPGSDEIQKAYEDAWIGRNGYQRRNGSNQRWALAFLGDCIAEDDSALTELFVVDLPESLDSPDEGPLEGTETRRPSPPLGVAQRRLTRTQNRKYPGIRGPRHWPRSHPDGSKIAVLMADDQALIQFHLVTTTTGQVTALTRLPFSIESAFSWSPDGQWLAAVADGSPVQIDANSGFAYRLAPKSSAPIRPEACVFSPDGKSIAYVRTIAMPNGEEHNQIFVIAAKHH